MLVVAALALTAVNLRPALTSAAAELDDIKADLALSGAAAGALTTLPVLCMGVFAPLAVVLARRFGLERTMVAALALIGLATGLRLRGLGVASLVATTFAVGVGIGVAQALVPSVVKAFFAAAPGSPTGLFTVCINLGALAGAALTLPIASALGGGWDVGLAVWGLLAVPALAVWLRLARHPGVLGRPHGGAAVARAPLDRRLALRVTAIMATLSLTFYIPLAWLTSAFQDAGRPETSAVALLALFVVIQIPCGLLVPTLASTPRARSRALAAMLTVTAAGLAGVALAPAAAPVLWTLLLGAGVGSTFPLGLTMPVDHTPTPAAAARLTGIVFSGGYVLASAGPAVVGALHDATGSFTVPFGLMAGLAAAVAPLAWWLRSAH